MTRMHPVRNLLLAVVGLVTTVSGVVLAQEEYSSASRSSRQLSFAQQNEELNDSLRIREGTRLTDREGVFRLDGDGAVFTTADGYELSALPNLNLERVIQSLKAVDEVHKIQWSVSGVVTEFNGRNYLLISRSVYKSSSSPPVPEQL